MKEKKFIMVVQRELQEVNDLLSQGWSIEKMSACSQGALAGWVCYVYLTKDN